MRISPINSQAFRRIMVIPETKYSNKLIVNTDDIIEIDSNNSLNTVIKYYNDKNKIKEYQYFPHQHQDSIFHPKDANNKILIAYMAAVAKKDIVVKV